MATADPLDFFNRSASSVTSNVQSTISRGIGGGLIANLGNRIASVFHSIGSGVVGILQPVWSALRSAAASMVTPLVSGLRGAVAGVGGHLIRAFIDLGHFVGVAFRGTMGAIGSVIAGIGSFIWTGITTAMTLVRRAVVSAITALSSSPLGMVALIVSATTLVGGAISLVRRVASSVASMAGSAVSTVGRVFTSAWGFVAAVGARAGALAVTGFHVVTDALGNLFHAVGGFLAGAWGWVRQQGTRLLRSFSGGSVGSVLGGVLSTVISSVRSFAGAILSLLGGLLKIGVATTAVAVFTTAMVVAARAAMEFAKSATVLAATSGFSRSGAGDILRRNRALGIGEEATSAMFGGQPAFMQRMKASFFGLPGADNPDANAQAAALFQKMRSSGMFGQMRANAMAKTMGYTSPEQMNMLMTDPRKLRAQTAWSDNLNKKMGLGPGALAKYAQDIPLALGKISAVWSALMMKLAGVGLPVLQRLLDVVINFSSANIDNIGAMIETAVKWVFVTAPVLLAQGLVTVSGIVAQGVGGLLDFAQLVATNVPNMLTKAVTGIVGATTWLADGVQRVGGLVVQGVANMLAGIGSTLGGWLDSLGDFLTDITSNSKNPLRHFALAIADFLDGIRVAIAGLLTTIGTNPLAMAILGPTVAGSAVASGNKMMDAPYAREAVNKFFRDNATINDLAGRSHSGADWVRRQGAAGAANVMQYGTAGVNWTAGELRGAGAGVGQLEQYVPALGKLLQQGVDLAQPIRDITINANTTAQAFLSKVGTEKQREEKWQREMLGATKEVVAAVKQTKDNPATDDALKSIAGQIGAHLVQGRAIGLTRSTR